MVHVFAKGNRNVIERGGFNFLLLTSTFEK